MSETENKTREKVSLDEINKLNNQKVESNGQVDNIDAFDRAFGRIFSKIGKYVVKNW